MVKYTITRAREILHVDAGQIRVNRKKLRKLSSAKITQYARAYEYGDQFPPIEVEDCGGFYTIRDGRHRFQAQLLVGCRTISVDIS